MIDQGKFGSAEAVVLLAISMSARIFLHYPAYLTETGGPAAWLTPIGGGLVALLGVLIMGRLLAKSPDKTVVQITEEALGPYLGTAVNFIYIIFFISVAALFAREFSEAMLIAALPFTPISIVILGFLTVSILGAYLGLEAMARTARLTYPFIVIGITILLASLYPYWNFHNIFPILGNGPYNVFVLGTFSTAAVTEVILAGVIVQSMGGHSKINSIGIRMVLLSFFFLLLMLLFTTFTHNWRISSEFSLPFYRLARTIYLGRFFQRIEAIYIIVWGFIGLLKIALTIYAASVTMAGSLKLPDYRPLIWPLGMVVFIGSLLPVDMPRVVELDGAYLRPGAWLPNYIIPVILLLVLGFRKRGKDAG